MWLDALHLVRDADHHMQCPSAHTEPIVCAHNKCLQRLRPDGTFVDALQLSSVFAVAGEGTFVFVTQSFSLDVY
jgi:hypothetical protein